MMLATMKSYPVLFWGLSVLFSMESISVSISDIGNYTSTTQPVTTTERAHNLTTAHRRHKETEQQPTVDSINSSAVTQTPLRRPAEVTAAATAETNVSLTVSSEEAFSSTQIHNYTSTTAGVVAMNTSNNTSSSRPPVSHISTVTPADSAQPSHSVNISKTEKPTDRHQQSAVTSAATAATTSEREVVSTSNLSSTTPDHSTLASFSVQEPISSTVSSTSVSSTSVSSTVTSLVSTSEPSHVFDPSTTSLSDNETETSNTSAGPPPPTSQPTSTTEALMSSTGQSSATESPTTSEVTITISSISTTAVSTSQSTAVLIPRIPKRLPITTTVPPTTTTTAPCDTSKRPSSTGAQSCTSSRGVVTHCLMAIATLAGLATIFMVSTIVLCTKLSSRKHRVRSPQQGTEMMCISSLLPERNYTYARQRNPVSNGVLLIPSGGDSDEDSGDNVTLSSFLPDNDRFV